MKKTLRLLIVEDSEDDALLLERELSKNGYDLLCERVDTPEALKLAFATDEWDIVVADYVMPHFSGLDALQMLREKGIDIPFIIVSGKIGEDTAVKAMKAGANDYILKGNLARLLPAVEREIADAEVRRRCRRVEDEKVILQQQLQQAQRLESLGVLAGGIALDFNNILAIIMGYCGLTKMHYETAEKNIPYIENAVERAAALCRQMMVYAGKAMLNEAPVIMRALVVDVVNMLKATVSQNVEFKTDFSSGIPSIIGDASQLRQVIMNLLVNASEAIGEAPGEVRISLTRANISVGQREKDYLGKIIPHGGYVCLEVSDTGCGMDDETLSRIFEPFFTTKFTGRGLGMSAVLGITLSHKGFLQLSSKPGEGSTFKVFLPEQVHDAASGEKFQPFEETAWHGNGTVLFVEDEEHIKLTTGSMLRTLGFTVLEALNGKEALELYIYNIEEITLVIMDIGMPVMDGYELFGKLKKLTPELPIIISSGFEDTYITARIPRNDIAGLLRKPYRFDQLRDVVIQYLC